jgi:hypothetical protein
MAIMNRPRWPSLLDPTFRTIYNGTEKKFPSMLGQIFNVQNSDKAYEKDTSVSGLGELVRKPEGDAIVYEDPSAGYPVTYTHYSFALGAMVTKEMYDDDQTNIIRKRPRDLANAKMKTRERLAADIFNYGFTAGGGGLATFTGGDAKALFATDHPLRTGATASNYTTADLDEDALEAGMVAMGATLDNKGQPQMVTADTLLVPPALEKEARILLESQGRVGTANNDINPYKGKLNLIVWPALGAAWGGSDTAWFLIDSTQAELNFFNRENGEVDGPEWDFDTKTAKWSVFARWSAGFSDWRGVYGSKGDNS